MIGLAIGVILSVAVIIIILLFRITAQVNQQLGAINQQVSERLKETSQAL